MWIAEWIVNPAELTRSLRCLADHVAIAVDLHQVGGAHLVEHHAVLVDEEVVLRARHARADMRVDEVGHPEVRDQPVERGEVAADLHSSSETPARAAGWVATFMGSLR